MCNNGNSFIFREQNYIRKQKFMQKEVQLPASVENDKSKHTITKNKRQSMLSK